MTDRLQDIGLFFGCFVFKILFVWFCVLPFAVVVCRRADVAVVVSHDGFFLVVLFRVFFWFVLPSGSRRFPPSRLIFAVP